VSVGSEVFGEARVTGLDAAPYLLEVARSAGSDAAFVESGMRSPPWTGPSFDGVALWFTAFGYFDEAANASILRGIRTVVRDGGRLALEVNHLPLILATFQHRTWVRHDSDVARELLLGAGFSHVGPLGSDGQPLTTESRRLIAVAAA